MMSTNTFNGSWFVAEKPQHNIFIHLLVKDISYRQQNSHHDVTLL